MEDKDTAQDSYNINTILGNLFSGCAYRIDDQNLDYHSKFIVKTELPAKGKMKFVNEDELVAIKLALKETKSFNFYVWEHGSHLYWNIHNTNEQYPFHNYPLDNYFRLKSEYKGWAIGNQYGI